MSRLYLRYTGSSTAATSVMAIAILVQISDSISDFCEFHISIPSFRFIIFQCRFIMAVALMLVNNNLSNNDKLCS